ncbi:helix-turn-helix domain-containing protein [Leptospira stimsonii]|uniref:Helix-turn-helix domain-containing protein n=1 Tax=Leptospira stimsonii TaxID=2202203 RepID=A0A396YTP1_9LEPT|nr:helix-turn-helix domain-containing protein [Leptospira stimsonii]RHX84734.1 helix-turn-helix domain-containing protein [Leptospira stimsonii]
MEGIHLRVPGAFLRDKRIKPKEKAQLIIVFGAMWSFSGRGNLCYASIGKGPDDEENPKIKRATLCSRSALTKNTVIKYKKRLKELGWISPKREGRGDNDTITLFEIAQLNTDIQNPKKDDSDEKNIPIVVFQNTNPNECASSGVHQEGGLVVQDFSTENILSTATSKVVTSEIKSKDSKLTAQALEEKFGKSVFAKSLAIATTRGMQSNLRYVLGICKNLQNESELHENSKKGSSWEDFINWSKERLTKSSIEILEKIQVEERSGSLLIKNAIPESLRMIVFKYFTEEIIEKIAIFFQEPGSNQKQEAA